MTEATVSDFLFLIGITLAHLVKWSTMTRHPTYVPLSTYWELTMSAATSYNCRSIWGFWMGGNNNETPSCTSPHLTHKSCCTIFTSCFFSGCSIFRWTCKETPIKNLYGTTITDDAPGTSYHKILSTIPILEACRLYRMNRYDLPITLLTADNLFTLLQHFYFVERFLIVLIFYVYNCTYGARRDFRHGIKE